MQMRVLEKVNFSKMLKILYSQDPQNLKFLQTGKHPKANSTSSQVNRPGSSLVAYSICLPMARPPCSPVTRPTCSRVTWPTRSLVARPICSEKHVLRNMFRETKKYDLAN